MFGFSKLAIVAAAFGAANAFITGIKPFEAGYLFQTASDPAANASTLPIVFTTGSTKVSFYDLSIAFGITKSSSLASNTTFGTPLNYTVDLVALGFSDTGPGEFTIEVPVKADQLPEGENDCAYVIVAAVTRAVGSLPDLTFRADQLIVPFNATIT